MQSNIPHSFVDETRTDRAARLDPSELREQENPDPAQAVLQPDLEAKH